MNFPTSIFLQAIRKMLPDVFDCFIIGLADLLNPNRYWIVDNFEFLQEDSTPLGAHNLSENKILVSESLIPERHFGS